MLLSPNRLNSFGCLIGSNLSFLFCSTATSSFATAIVALSDPREYSGGLYVQAVPGVASAVEHLREAAASAEERASE